MKSKKSKKPTPNASRSPQGNEGLSWMFIAKASFIVVLLAVYYGTDLLKPTTKETATKTQKETIIVKKQPKVGDSFKIVGSVPRIQWQPDKPFAEEIAKARKPVILTNTVASTWPAITTWTPEYIAEHVETLPYVKNSTKNVFVLALQERNFINSLPFLEETRRNDYTMHNITTEKFVAEAKPKGWGDSFNRRFLYYFGALEDWKAIHEDLAPLDMLLLNTADPTELNQDDKYKSATNVWMGHANVTAQAHYDKSHNFFVQIYGTKRWLLFPPSAWRSMYLYPSLHPHYHQSQVDWDLPDNEAFPQFTEAEAFEAILKPGDLMYIPPYWFHRVEAVDFCISSSTVSPSEEELAFSKVYWKALPLSKNWSLKKKVIVISTYVKMLLDKIGNSGLVKDMLLDNRYLHMRKPLRESSPLAIDFERHECYRNNVMQDNDEMSSLKEKITAVIDEQMAHLSQINKDIRDISIADYIEELSSWAVGPENVIAVLEYCF